MAVVGWSCHLALSGHKANGAVVEEGNALS
jgi:hypothetical protein